MSNLPYSKGVKHDNEKLRWDLVPWKQFEGVVKVLTFGAFKYEVDNWQKLPDFKRRYFAASQRHLMAWWNGERKDPESGHSHLAHVICCVLFLMWFDDNG